MAAALAAFVLLAPAAQAAEHVRLGEAMVEYDPSVWKVMELSGVASLSFTCIAADCKGEPQVHAVTTAIEGDVLRDFFYDGARQDGVPLVDPSPRDGVPFEAVSGWSGCRARDNPILSARGRQGGIAYYFNAGVSAGCNFRVYLPKERFVELLRGVTAIGPE
jgi:hypothetical protein